MHSKTRNNDTLNDTLTGFAGVASLVAPFAPRACESSACESSTSARGQAVQSEVRAAVHFGPKGLGTKAPERVPAGVRAHAQPTTQRHVLLCCAAVRAVGSRAVAPLHCMRPSILVVYIERP